jgi:hypothetical protein
MPKASLYSGKRVEDIIVALSCSMPTQVSESVPAADPPSGVELEAQTDAETLLEGEDPASTHIDDAVHWVRVYGELFSVKMSLIDRADQLLQGVSDDAMREADLDQRLLRAEAERFRRRLDFWTNRTKVLATTSDVGGG